MNWGMKMPAPPLSTAAVGMLEGEPATKEGCLGDSQVSIRQGNEGEVRTRALCLPAGGWQCERKRAHKAVRGQEHVRNQPDRQAFGVVARVIQLWGPGDQVRSRFQKEFRCQVQMESRWLGLVMPSEAPQMAVTRQTANVGLARGCGVAVTGLETKDLTK